LGKERRKAGREYSESEELKKCETFIFFSRFKAVWASIGVPSKIERGPKGRGKHEKKKVKKIWGEPSKVLTVKASGKGKERQGNRSVLSIKFPEEGDREGGLSFWVDQRVTSPKKVRERRKEQERKEKRYVHKKMLPPPKSYKEKKNNNQTAKTQKKNHHKKKEWKEGVLVSNRVKGRVGNERVLKFEREDVKMIGIRCRNETLRN